MSQLFASDQKPTVEPGGMKSFVPDELESHCEPPVLPELPNDDIEPVMSHGYVPMVSVRRISPPGKIPGAGSEPVKFPWPAAPVTGIWKNPGPGRTQKFEPVTP